MQKRCIALFINACSAQKIVSSLILVSEHWQSRRFAERCSAAEDSPQSFSSYISTLIHAH